MRCCQTVLDFPSLLSSFFPHSLSVAPSLSSPRQAELHHLEELLSKERKERDRIIASSRKKIEESKAQAEKVDRRVRRARWYTLYSMCNVGILY